VPQVGDEGDRGFELTHAGQVFPNFFSTTASVSGRKSTGGLHRQHTLNRSLACYPAKT
jgi:hypothetical protein